MFLVYVIKYKMGMTILLLLPSLCKMINRSWIWKHFPGGSEVKASACNVGDLGLVPGSGRFPWRRKWQPTPVFLPGESQGQRSLVGYSPRGRKESDTTEWLHFHFHMLYKSVSPSAVSDSVRPQRRQSTRLLHLWHFPGKSTRVGCHFLLQGNLPDP